MPILPPPLGCPTTTSYLHRRASKEPSSAQVSRPVLDDRSRVGRCLPLARRPRSRSRRSRTRSRVIQLREPRRPAIARGPLELRYVRSCSRRSFVRRRALSRWLESQAAPPRHTGARSCSAVLFVARSACRRVSDAPTGRLQGVLPPTSPGLTTPCCRCCKTRSFLGFLSPPRLSSRTARAHPKVLALPRSALAGRHPGSGSTLADSQDCSSSRPRARRPSVRW